MPQLLCIGFRETHCFSLLLPPFTLCIRLSHLLPTQIVIYVRATPVIDSTCLSAATTSTPRQCWLSLSRCYYWPCYLNLACNQAAKQMTLVSAFNSNLDTTEFTANNLFGLHIVFRVPHMPKLARMSLLTFICRSLSHFLPACLANVLYICAA